jgi:hypothetical protein
MSIDRWIRRPATPIAGTKRVGISTVVPVPAINETPR